jgi:hypothetical protein
MNAHELGFTAFLAEPSRRRLRTLLELGAKRRVDVRALLHHAVKLNSLYCEPLSGASASPRLIEAVLRARGAPGTCFVISSSPEFDGREMPLAEALAAINGSSEGAFISCIPGKHGYYEYEDMKSAFILQR